MKLKSLFLLGLASVASLLSSCVKEADVNAPKFAAQIKASEDGIRHDTISVEGGELVVELLAAEAWSATVEPGTSMDEVDDITIEPASGSASSSIVEVVAKLPVNKGNDRSVKLSFIGSTHSAAVSFIQKGERGERLLECTVSEFIKKPVDASIYYLLTGEVGTIANEKYGNFNIIDPETREEIFIYGLGVKEDLSKQYVFKDYGIKQGDLITIASTRGVHETTQEGMNSYYITHKKSEKPSIRLGSSEVVAVVGTTFELPVVSNLVSWTLSSDVEWLNFNPASGSESTTVVVSVSDAGEGDTATITLSAEGLESVTCAVTRTNVQDATAAEINAAEDGKVFRVTGIVSKIENTKYGNLYIKDYTGEVYVYGTNNFAEENIAEGDVITVVGSKTSFKESPQMKNVDVEKHYSIKDTKVADFRAAEDNNEVYYRLTGKVTKSTEEYTKFDLEQYGNFALEDESGNVYVYGVLPGWGAAKGQFGSLEVKEGDTITIIAYKTTFKGLTQAGGAVYISHVAGEEPEPGPEPEPQNALKNCGEINAAILADKTDLTIKLENPAEITLMGSDKKSIFVQDETGAVLVYNEALYTTLSEAGAGAGHAIQGEFTATATVFKGLPEITAAEVGTSNITTTKKFPCLSLTIDELLADFDKYLNCKVKISDVAVNDGWSGSDYNGVIAQGETTIPLYVKNYNSAITVNVPTGAKGDFTGFVAYNKTTKQLTFWENSGFEATELPGTITVKKSSLSLEEGATAELAATVNSGAALSYASSDESVATVSADGVVTAVKEGTATITISAPAQDIYTGASAEVAVTVKAASAGGDDPVVAAGTVLWKETFGDWGGSSTTFTSLPVLGEYDGSGTEGYEENANVSLTASSDQVRGTTASGTNCTSGHLWFNKNENADVTTSPIRLYGATNLILSYDQGTGSSSLTPSYSVDNGATWVELAASGPGASTDNSYAITVDAETIILKFSHFSTNAKNTRFDNPSLTVAE